MADVAAVLSAAATDQHSWKHRGDFWIGDSSETTSMANQMLIRC